MNKINPPKRKVGQCCSCIFFECLSIKKCECNLKKDIEISDFCYDYMDMEETNEKS